MLTQQESTPCRDCSAQNAVAGSHKGMNGNSRQCALVGHWNFACARGQVRYCCRHGWLLYRNPHSTPTRRGDADVRGVVVQPLNLNGVPVVDHLQRGRAQETSAAWGACPAGAWAVGGSTCERGPGENAELHRGPGQCVRMGARRQLLLETVAVGGTSVSRHQAGRWQFGRHKPATTTGMNRVRQVVRCCRLTAVHLRAVGKRRVYG